MPSGKFDMYMRQVSRPRPRRVVPVWGRSAVGLGIGLGGSVSDGLAGACLVLT